MARSVSIFGVTGSVGQSTIKVIQQHRELYDVKVVTANNNVQQLAKDARDLNAEYAVICDETLLPDLKNALSGTDVTVMAGCDALIEAASIPVDFTMAAIVGMAGLEPLLTSIQHSQTVGVANKEPLVAAGEMVLGAAQQHGTTILPIDSEHNAVFQILENENKSSIERIILTASGGPFRQTPIEALKAVTVEQALAHPTWSMGAKISIDSATMMNKALEVIEAKRLFNIDPQKVEVLVHPQSLVHAMVEYSDGSVLSQMGASDMCTPITNALGWPKRIRTPGKRMDFKTLSQLTFESVDTEKFPFVSMAYDVLEQKQSASLVMNTANEVAVEAFLSHKIAFLDIYRVVSECLQTLEICTLKSLNDILEYDSFVRKHTESLIGETYKQLMKV